MKSNIVTALNKKRINVVVVVVVIVREACAAPASLSCPREPCPAARRSQDSCRPAGMQKLLNRGEYAV